MTRYREFRAKAMRTLEESGAVITCVEQNKHTKIKFETPGGTGSLTISSTPSASNATLNVAADIRQKIAEMTAAKDSPRGEVVGGAQTEVGSQVASAPADAPRIRQAPVAYSRDRAPSFPNPGGHSGAIARVRKSTAVRTASEHVPLDPVAKAREILELMQDFAIGELAMAVERRHPRWLVILANDAIGVPYFAAEVLEAWGLVSASDYESTGVGPKSDRDFGRKGTSSSKRWRRLRRATPTPCQSARGS